MKKFGATLTRRPHSKSLWKVWTNSKQAVSVPIKTRVDYIEGSVKGRKGAVTDVRRHYSSEALRSYLTESTQFALPQSVSFRVTRLPWGSCVLRNRHILRLVVVEEELSDEKVDDDAEMLEREWCVRVKRIARRLCLCLNI